MKNEQDQVVESDNHNNYEKTFEKIYCVSEKEAFLLCTNDECTKHSFLCFDEQCKCHSEHPKCLKSTKKSLTIALEDKLVSYRNIEKRIKDEIQKGIDELSKFETLLLNQCEEKFKEFVGLTDFQKDFMKAIKLGKVEGITGKTIWNIQLNLKKSQKVTKMMEKLQIDINSMWTQFEKTLQQLHFDIKDRLEFFGSVLFQDSKIVTNKKEAQNIELFFQSQQQSIRSAKLLFRGSENNFTAANFHNVCNNQGQTLTICENTYGKKIGGYTSYPWNSGNSYYSDSTGKSFVFSLSNNHKFVAQNTTNSIYCHQNYGPTFGAHDLYVADNCHQNFTSYCGVNITYKNTNYTTGNLQSYFQLVGSQQNYNFKVKEYEVWKIQFAA